MIIIIVRWVIFITFLLLVVGEPVLFFWLKRFQTLYITRHQEVVDDLLTERRERLQLEERVARMEHRHDHE